ncbi:MAG: AAA family ATPase [Planctomycetales bacterium]
MLSHADIVAALEAEDAFPEGGPVERRESHISVVFLTRDRAWKLLKPVQFDFLDFSTREARYVVCWNELLLNRRLAPDVYLDVVPVTDDGGRARVGGLGIPIDWLIVMRRLPEAGTLQARIEAGRARQADIDRVLDVLAPFFAAAPTDAAIAANGRPEAVHRNASENFAVLAAHADGGSLSAERVARLRSMQLQFIAEREALFEARIAAGRVREGHGDLKPEHCYVSDGNVAIVDGVGFSKRLRCVDTLDEISFLAVDLAVLGREDLAEHLRDEYRRRTGDDAPPELAAFFESYRLAVRAKVACLSAGGRSADERAELLRDAAQCVDEALARLGPHHAPRLIAVFGLSGTGKSTVAGALAERIGAARLCSDEVRKEIHGLAARERGTAELYSAAANERTYAALFDRAADRLQSGISVIVDATFRRRRDRERLCAVAAAAGVTPLFVECRCPPAVARRRIAARGAQGRDASDADVAVYESQARRYEPPGEIPVENLLSIDTDGPLEDSIRPIVSRLAVV